MRRGSRRTKGEERRGDEDDSGHPAQSRCFYEIGSSAQSKKISLLTIYNVEVWVSLLPGSFSALISLEILCKKIIFSNHRVKSKENNKEYKAHNKILCVYKSSKQLIKYRNRNLTRRKVFWGISGVLRWSVVHEQYCFDVFFLFFFSFSVFSSCLLVNVLLSRVPFRRPSNTSSSFTDFVQRQSCMCSMHRKSNEQKNGIYRNIFIFEFESSSSSSSLSSAAAS